jgi:hypothetical protein
MKARANGVTKMSKPTKLHEAAAKHKLAVKAEFIPFSQSRSKDQKDCNLNWRVTLTRDGRDLLATKYSAGQGHCPAYKNPPKTESGKLDKYAQRKRIADECESGKKSWMTEFTSSHGITKRGAAILPDECDVIYSLVSDSDVLNYSGFEQWASEFGYDPDSRNGEKIYQACMAIALQLRNGIGEKALSELQQACQDC